MLAWAGDNKSAVFRDDNTGQNHRYFSKYRHPETIVEEFRKWSSEICSAPRRAHCITASHSARKCLAWGVLGVVQAINTLPVPTFWLNLLPFTYFEKFSQPEQGVFLASLICAFLEEGMQSDWNIYRDLHWSWLWSSCWEAAGLLCSSWWLRDNEMYSGSPGNWRLSHDTVWLQQIRGNTVTASAAGELRRGIT